MFIQVNLGRKAFLTNPTGVGFLISVQLFMRSQVPFSHKALFADTADVRLHTGVKCFVTSKGEFCGEAFLTSRARVRSFACVPLFVCIQSFFRSEAFLTSTAGTFPRVQVLVINKLHSTMKALLTHPTHIGPLTGVNPDVCFKAAFVGEQFLTKPAYIGHLLAIHSLMRGKS